VGLHPHSPLALRGWLDVGDEVFLLGSSFLDSPQGVRLLLGGVPLLLHAHDGCVRRGHEWLLEGHVVLRGLIAHDVVALAEVDRRLVCHVVVVVELALGAWRLELDDVDALALEGGLANHCHVMDFGKLDDCLDDEDELVEDLHPMMNPKNDAVTGFSLTKTRWRKRGQSSWHEIIPFW
jgi:hypothetical protein